MDSKVSSSDAKATAHPPTENKNLVMKFCEFAYKVLNTDMDDFFDRHLDMFDQDDEELQQRGETLEQYDVYQRYVQELEMKFDDFSANEGYRSARECFDEINGLIVKDEEDRKKAMLEIAEKLRQAQASWQRQLLGNDDDDAPSAADSKDTEVDAKPSSKAINSAKGDDESSKHDSDAKGGHRSQAVVHAAGDKDSSAGAKDDTQEETPPPILLFFQPISMEMMLNHTLSLTEYSTFSYIMRSKVRQRKLLSIMSRKVDMQFDDVRDRRRNLGSDSHYRCSPMALITEYESMISRVCGLTPNQRQFTENTRTMLDAPGWEKLIHDEEHDLPERKKLLKRYVVTAFMALWRLICIEQHLTIRGRLTTLAQTVDQISTHTVADTLDFHQTAAKFLDLAHESVDETEQAILKILQAHENQKSQRKLSHQVEHLAQSKDEK